MKMGNGFAAVFSVVDDDAEAFFSVAFLPGDVADPQKEVTKKLLISGAGFRDADNGLLGNKKEVNRGLRGDIPEAEAEIVFINDVRRNLAGDDFFKEGHGKN